MNYEVHLTRHAERDLEAAADYIEYQLFNSDAADALYDEFETAAKELTSFPEKWPLAQDRVLKNWGVHFFSVKNYYAFFVVRSEKIFIIRFLHQRRDWIAILRTEITAYR